MVEANRHAEGETRVSSNMPGLLRAQEHAHQGWLLTGMFSMMMRFTVDTSLVRTQYLVVERLKACM